MPRSWPMPALAVCLGVSLVPCAPRAEAGVPEELPLHHWTVEDGLPSPGLQDLFQDRLGFVWIGFYSAGLARYDGRRVERYGTANGLPDLTIRTMREDGRGHLWVGCETGLVVSTRPLGASLAERARFVPRIAGVSLAQTRIRRNFLTVDRRGAVWVATTGQGVLSYEWGPGDELIARRHRTDRDGDGIDEPVQSLAGRADGSVWAGLTDGTLIRFAPGAPPRFIAPAASGLATTPVTALFESRSGVLWGGMADGTVWRLVADRLPAETVARELREPASSIVEGEGGEIWVASLGDGVLRLRPALGQARHYTRRDGLLNDSVLRLLRDHEGNLWVAQFGGISRLRPDFAAFGQLTAVPLGGGPPALPEASAMQVLAPTRDRPTAWIGTTGGVVGFTAGGERVALSKSDGLTSDEVYALGLDGRGRLWVGTLNGLNAIAPRQAAPPALPASRRTALPALGADLVLTTFPFGSVYSCERLPLPLDERGGARVEAVCFNSTSGLACLLGEQWLLFRRETGFPAAGTTAIAVDGDGHLWLGTHRDGLLRSIAPVNATQLLRLATPVANGARELRTPLFQPWWNRARGAPSDVVRDLVAVGRELWVGTAGGVAVLGGRPPAALAVLDQGSGLGGDNVFTLARSPRGTLWVAQSRGLAELDPQRRRVLRTVSRADGLIDDEAWTYGSLDVADDGTVYFATPSGVSLYRPWLDRRNTVPPRVHLRSALYREDWSGNNEAVFEFAALSFADERGVRFRTRLVGYEDHWSAESAEPSLRYTNLPAFLLPRAYRFEVIAGHGDGVWNSVPAVHTLRVRPAWWLSWWALLATGALLVAAVVSLHRWRTRGLERLVAARTAEVMAQAAELEALDDIVDAINRHVEVHDLLRALLERAVLLVPQAEKAAFLVIDHDTRTTEVVAAIGYERERLEGITFSVDEVMRRYAAQSETLAEGVWLLRSFAERAGAEKVRHLPTPASTLAMSVTLGGRLEGFLALDSFSSAEAFGRSDLRKLARLRRHAITAIAKARTLEEIRDASEAKSAFLASMSHELRTPLSSIIGFAEILSTRLRGTLDPRFQGFLESIHEAGRHLLAIINDVLDLAKVEAGHMEVIAETFALRETLETLAATMASVAAKHRVELRVEVESGLGPITSDLVKLKQIVYNLVSNAVKFSPAGATVLISARAVAPDQVAISVVDQGTGLTPEELARVFEEFRQVGSAETRQLGTGLGLSIVERFATLLGGSIEVTSAPGEGSTFTVLLPRATPTGQPQDAGEPAVHGAPRPGG